MLLFTCAECVICFAVHTAESAAAEEAGSASSRPGKEAAPVERIEDIHKPSIIAFHAMIHTFVRARQLK